MKYRNFTTALTENFGEPSVREVRGGFSQDPNTKALRAVLVNKTSTDSGRILHQEFNSDRSVLVTEFKKQSKPSRISHETLTPHQVYIGGTYLVEKPVQKRVRCPDGWYKVINTTKTVQESCVEYLGDYILTSVTQTPEGTVLERRERV